MERQALDKPIRRISGFFWGLLMIAGGSLALAQNQGYLTNLQPIFWVVVFAAISVTSLVFYFLSGVRNWGLLFPAGVFGSLALLITLAENNVDNPAIAAPLFISIGLPFVVAYLLDRANNWWAVIPAGVMAFLTYVVLVAENFGGEAVGAGLFFILAATFGTVFVNRREWWAALVSYIMSVLGVIVLASAGSRPELIGSLMLLAIALPFFVVYLSNSQERWWALIPAGVLTSTSLLASAVLLPGISSSFGQFLEVILYLGIAATFSFIWLRHNQPWAALFALAAVLTAGFSVLTSLQPFWPVLIIVAGIYLLYQAMRPRTT